MAKTKQQKEVAIKDLSDKLSRVKSAVFTSFDDLPVSAVNQLRRQCRAEQVDYVVMKKTLLKKSLAEAGVSGVDADSMAGGVAAVFGYTDEITPAKIVSTFAKSHEVMQIFGGLMDRQFVGLEMIKHLAALPSRQELLAKMVGSLSAPMSGLVNVLQGNLRGLVIALNAIREQKQS
ncbi:50S ribosomal protein L10 [Candidatus Falkowbacteria bacterium]|nr:50S ribosomal protein L10 [Candidatus Falkowbacteria bacterium]